MDEYNLKLTEAEANAVLAAFTQQPYYLVADLIHKNRDQCPEV